MVANSTLNPVKAVPFEVTSLSKEDQQKVHFGEEEMNILKIKVNQRIIHSQFI